MGERGLTLAHDNIRFTMAFKSSLIEQYFILLWYLYTWEIVTDLGYRSDAFNKWAIIILADLWSIPVNPFLSFFLSKALCFFLRTDDLTSEVFWVLFVFSSRGCTSYPTDELCRLPECQSPPRHQSQSPVSPLHSFGSQLWAASGRK